MNRIPFLKGILRLKVVTPATLKAGHIVEEMNYLNAIGGFSKLKGTVPTRYMKVYEPSVELKSEKELDIKFDEIDFMFLKDIAKRAVKDGDEVTIKLNDDESIATNKFDKVYLRKWMKREALPKHILNVVRTLSGTGNRPAIEVVKALSKREIVIMTKEDFRAALIDAGKYQRKFDEKGIAEHKELSSVELRVDGFLADKDYYHGDDVDTLEPVLVKSEEQKADETIAAIVETTDAPVTEEVIQ